MKKDLVIPAISSLLIAATGLMLEVSWITISGVLFLILFCFLIVKNTIEKDEEK